MSFKFIDEENTEFTAADASYLTDDDLTMSGVFVNQEAQQAFMIGNTGSDLAIFNISTSGVNTTINDDVEYSIDNGNSWATTATVSGVEPNGVSERIRVRYTPAEDEYLGVGSFLIKVNEE